MESGILCCKTSDF